MAITVENKHGSFTRYVEPFFLFCGGVFRFGRGGQTGEIKIGVEMRRESEYGPRRRKFG